MDRDLATPRFRSTRPASRRRSPTPGTRTTAATESPGIRGTGRPRPGMPDRSRPSRRSPAPTKYSWLKAPRYDDEPMEVGPLARMLVGYVEGRRPRSATCSTGAAAGLGVGPDAALGHPRPDRRPGARGTGRRESARRMASTTSSRTSPPVTSRSPTSRQWDPEVWPRQAQGCVAGRGAPRRRRPLGDDPGRQDRGIPDRRREHVERLAARRARSPGGAGGGARRDAGRGPQPAARDPADRPLVRSLHGVRGPCLRPARSSARSRSGSSREACDDRSVRGTSRRRCRPTMSRSRRRATRSRPRRARAAFRSTSGRSPSASRTGSPPAAS